MKFFQKQDKPREETNSMDNNYRKGLQEELQVQLHYTSMSSIPRRQ